MAFTKMMMTMQVAVPWFATDAFYFVSVIVLAALGVLAIAVSVLCGRERLKRVKERQRQREKEEVTP